jgi:trans-aconitate methyltransferase
MQGRDTDFYNAESAAYSARRYPAHAATFTQFFFKERLRLTLEILSTYIQGGESLFEVGCADGVVVRAIHTRFPGLSSIEATDLSPDMITVAKRLSRDAPIQFSVREGSILPSPRDIILEVGVLNYTDEEADFKAVYDALSSNGIYICSLSGRSSLQHVLKGPGEYRHLKSYKEYETELKKFFIVKKVIGVGIFAPWLWKLPSVARIAQPVFETFARILFPSLMHEKIYVLGKK